MKNKAYLGSAILLLAASAIGIGLWLNHQAERKREEKKKALYGYWVHKNPQKSQLEYIEVADNQVTLAGSDPMPTAPAFIDDEGNAKIVAVIPETKKNFILSMGDNLNEMSATGQAPNKPDLTLIFKRTTEADYRAFQQPIDLGNKTRFYMDNDRAILLIILSDGGMEFSRGGVMLFVESHPGEFISAKNQVIHSAQGRWIIFDPNRKDHSDRFGINFFGKDTPSLYGKMLHPVTLKGNLAEKENVLRIVSTGTPPQNRDHWEKFFAKLCSTP